MMERGIKKPPALHGAIEMVVESSDPVTKQLMEAAFSGDSIYLSFGQRDGLEIFPGKRYFITTISIQRITDQSGPGLSRITFNFTDGAL